MIAENDWMRLRAKLMHDLAALSVDISSKFKGQANYYALIDAAQVHVSPNFRDFYGGLERVGLFSLTKEHRITELGPQLILIGDHFNSGVTAHLVRTMKYGWPVSWIVSDLSPKNLSHHLAKYMNGMLANGAEVLVRYYDPRLLPAFLANFDKLDREALMAPLVCWAWWNRNFELVVEAGGNSQQLPLTDAVKISAEMQNKMAKAATVDFIHSEIVEGSDPDEFASWPVHVLNAAVRKQIEKARHLGLTRLDNVQLFVSLALRVHPEFLTLIPSFQGRVERVRDEEPDLISIVLAADDNEWDALGESGKAALERLRQEIAHELYHG